MTTVPGYEEDFMILGITSPNAVFGGFKLAPWSERDITQFEVQPLLNAELNKVTGLQTAVFRDRPCRARAAVFPSSL